MGQASSLSAQIENLRYSFRGGEGMAKSPYGETRDPHVWGYQRCGEWDRLPACLRKLKIYATLLEATMGWRSPLDGETRDPHVWGYQRCGEWDRLPACLRKLKIYATLLEATTGWRSPRMGKPVIRMSGVTRDAVNGTGFQPVCAN